MKQPHKHRDLIISWANGEEIQIKKGNGEWTDISNPCWEGNCEYRIKQEVIRYRVALFDDLSTTTCDEYQDEKRIEKGVSFKKWLTDWIEVEV